MITLFTFTPRSVQVEKIWYTMAFKKKKETKNKDVDDGI
jgi:hypothetical protein